MPKAFSSDGIDHNLNYDHIIVAIYNTCLRVTMEVATATATKTIIVRMAGRTIQVPKQTSHLELARQSLRDRFHVKFLSRMEQEETKHHAAFTAPAASAMAKHHPDNDNSKKYLEAARVRLQVRFQDKFPGAMTMSSSSPASSVSWMIDPKVVVDSSGNNKPPYLEQARDRLRHRFQLKFLPDFTGFSATLDEALACLEDEAFGKEHAVILTQPNGRILAVNDC